VIKEMAANKSLATSKKGSAGEEGVTYKVLVLTEVDRLSRQAQAALRRTMEKYSSSCRLILVCNNQSKVIDPVRSRCLGIRVGAPSVDDVRFNIICVSTMYFVSYYIVLFTPVIHVRIDVYLSQTCRHQGTNHPQR
jgi:hypothetical protein